MFFHKKSKNAAKMNKIVQKWQFWMTFYTTMKMEVGISLNGPNKWFPPYWFLIAQHMKYPKIIMRAPVHFFWVVTTLGLQCSRDFFKSQFRVTRGWHMWYTFTFFWPILRLTIYDICSTSKHAHPPFNLSASKKQFFPSP